AGEQWVQSQVQLTVARSMTIGSSETILEGDSDSSSKGTSTKALLGTFEFMAPEQKEGQEADARTDLYAVGLIAYRLLTGEKTIGMSLPSELVEGLDQAWDGWIKKALAGNSDERFQSAEEMLEAMPDGANTIIPDKVADKRPKKLGFSLSMGALIFLALGYLGFETRDMLTGQSKRMESVDKEIAVSDSFHPVILKLYPKGVPAKVWFGTLPEMAPNNENEVRIEIMDTGEYELTVKAEGYQPIITHLEVPEGGIQKSIHLEPILGILEVSTNPGVEVIAEDELGNQFGLGTVGSSGILLCENILRIGKYTVYLSAEKRESMEFPVELEYGRVVKLERVLSPQKGQLRVVTQPPEAMVEVSTTNWSKSGRSPLTIKEVPTEEKIEIIAIIDGYRTWKNIIQLEAAEVKSVNINDLTPFSGSLTLSFNKTVPAGIIPQLIFEIDGDRVRIPERNGEITIHGLSAGESYIKVIHPLYENYLAKFLVQDALTTTLEVHLVPKDGLLTIDIAPENVKWELIVNGNAYGKRQTYSLPSQVPLEIELVAEGYKSEKVSILIPAAGNKTWSLNLNPLTQPNVGHDWKAPLLRSGYLDMKWVEPGQFTLGSPLKEQGIIKNEGPQVSVDIPNGFWIGKYEITRGQYNSVMGKQPSSETNDSLRKPIIDVSWNEANIFCKILTDIHRNMGYISSRHVYTLPSEAQWEYACRAGSLTAYHNGNRSGKLKEVAWFRFNSEENCKSVGLLSPNDWGLYDMHGNAAEWCLDWYEDQYDPNNYIGGNSGPSFGSKRVIRGGSFSDIPDRCRSAARSGQWSFSKYENVGFRVALYVSD
ncbi:MAG: SUMF1/EgtB/PvdO family nonheme iron enzyme, partial [Allomuricauda sp.]